MKRTIAFFVCTASIFAQTANFKTGQAARLVIGQTTFTSQDTNSSDTILGAVSGLAYGADTLFVTDSNRVGAFPSNHRVMIYKGVSSMLPSPTDELGFNAKCPACVGKATVVLGQPDFTTTTETIPATQSSLRLPTAVATDGVRVVVADTNHNRVLIWNRIPTINNQPADVVLGQDTFTTAALPGQTPTAKSMRGPQGVWIGNGKLYVADTNNHAIRVIDLKTKQTSTLRINGLTPPAKSMEKSASDSGPNSEAINVPSQRLRTGSKAFLTINVDLPDGYHLNPAAPQRYKVSVDRESSIKIESDSAAKVSKDLKLPLRIPISVLQSGEANIRAQVTLYYCREDNTGTCRIKTLVWQAPIEISDATDAPTEVKLQGKLMAE